ncbi:MAG: HIT domain-containing protein [Nitrospirae bacterium]|nr:HIT domain-containing protein [Nitrospirota bacterium]
MNVLWAPWRMAYVQNTRKAARCIFCAKIRERRDATNLVLHRGTHGFVIMNLFPYNSGHLMVAPYAHVDSLESLPPESALELITLTNLSLRVLRAEIGPEGFNLGINLGRVSGAGIEAHVHLHIVPRWNGDTNFMPLFAETRVIPEHLLATYRKLRARFRMVLAHRPATRAKPAVGPRTQAGQASRKGRTGTTTRRSKPGL